jgi:hypothetical protein
MITKHQCLQCATYQEDVGRGQCTFTEESLSGMSESTEGLMCMPGTQLKQEALVSEEEVIWLLKGARGTMGKRLQLQISIMLPSAQALRIAMGQMQCTMIVSVYVNSIIYFFLRNI